MTTYRNISDRWGECVEVTADDYRQQAATYGLVVEIEEREDGIYIDGERVARTLETITLEEEDL